MDTLGLGDHVVPEATNTCSPPTEQVVAAHVEKDRQEEKNCEHLGSPTSTTDQELCGCPISKSNPPDSVEVPRPSEILKTPEPAKSTSITTGVVTTRGETTSAVLTAEKRDQLNGFLTFAPSFDPSTFLS